MKMMYEKPVMDVEQFMANEYFAACGDTNIKYLFECNAGSGQTSSGNKYTVAGEVFFDTNHNHRLDSGDESYMRYAACGTHHEANTTDEFFDGFFNPDANIYGVETMPVKIWKGKNGNDVHCTKNLDMDKWETAKS